MSGEPLNTAKANNDPSIHVVQKKPSVRRAGVSFGEGRNAPKQSNILNHEISDPVPPRNEDIDEHKQIKKKATTKKYSRRQTVHSGGRAKNSITQKQGLEFAELLKNEKIDLPENVVKSSDETKELFRLTDAIMRLNRIEMENCLTGDLKQHLEKALGHLTVLQNRASQREHNVGSVINKQLSLLQGNSHGVADWIAKEYMNSSSTNTHSSPKPSQVRFIDDNKKNNNDDITANSAQFAAVQRKKRHTAVFLPGDLTNKHGRLSLIMRKKQEGYEQSKRNNRSPTSTNPHMPVVVEKDENKNDTINEDDNETANESNVIKLLSDNESDNDDDGPKDFASAAREKINNINELGRTFYLEDSVDPITLQERQMNYRGLMGEYQINNDIIQCLSKIHDWNEFDVFELDRLTNHHPMTVAALHLIDDFQCDLDIDMDIMCNFLQAIEAGYHSDNLYHNSIHAADVTQNISYFFRDALLQDVFYDKDILSGIIAACIHDVDHPGVNNTYMIMIESPLATMYNDVAVLENHSIAKAFRIMNHPSCNIFKHVNKIDKNEMRKAIISMVLHTDIQQHMPMLKAFEERTNYKVENNMRYNKNDLDDRRTLLDMALHCADIGNPAKPWNLYSEWVPRVTGEFYSQGDMQLELGEPIIDMFDRSATNLSIGQVAFIKVIAKPLYVQWLTVVKNSKVCLVNMDDNVNKFNEDANNNNNNDNSPESTSNEEQ